MPTQIPPAGSHFITLEVFEEMKALYASDAENLLAPPFKGKNILCTAELFNAHDIRSLTGVTGCAAVCIYYGLDDDLKIHAMLVAVDADGNDILPPAGPVTFTGDGGVILEDAQRCPPLCR